MRQSEKHPSTLRKELSQRPTRRWGRRAFLQSTVVGVIATALGAIERAIAKNGTSGNSDVVHEVEAVRWYCRGQCHRAMDPIRHSWPNGCHTIVKKQDYVFTEYAKR